jgi:hypothetical protein
LRAFSNLPLNQQIKAVTYQVTRIEYSSLVMLKVTAFIRVIPLSQEWMFSSIQGHNFKINAQ